MEIQQDLRRLEMEPRSLRRKNRRLRPSGKPQKLGGLR